VPYTPDLTDAKRALLEKYLRGEATVPAWPSSGIADSAHDASVKPRGRAVPVQTGGSRPPFFFLHAQWRAGGFFCYPMAKALGPDQPFYAVEPYMFDGIQEPPTFEGVAAAHLEFIRAIQPKGPYRLGGWCGGGLIAYEMARQLRAEGQEVETLVLMDPESLVYPLPMRMLHRVVTQLGSMLRAGRDRQLDWFLAVLQRRALRPIFYPDVVGYTRHVYWYLRYPHYRESTRNWPTGRKDYPGIYHWIAMGYKPADVYPRQLTFIWSKLQPFRMGWRTLEAARPVEVHVLPATHTACLDEHLGELSGLLRACLDRSGRGDQAVDEESSEHR
jgi:hypothetical protein